MANPFGVWLRAQLEKRPGWTQEEVGKWVGMSTAQVANILSMDNLPRRATIHRICEALNLPVEEGLAAAGYPPLVSLDEDVEDVARTIGQRVAYYRQLAGVTQAELARQCGRRDRTIVTHWERGFAEIPASALYMISQALQVPVSLFFGELNAQSHMGSRLPATKGDIDRLEALIKNLGKS